MGQLRSKRTMNAIIRRMNCVQVYDNWTETLDTTLKYPLAIPFKSTNTDECNECFKWKS